MSYNRSDQSKCRILEVGFKFYSYVADYEADTYAHRNPVKCYVSLLQHCCSEYLLAFDWTITRMFVLLFLVLHLFLGKKPVIHPPHLFLFISTDSSSFATFIQQAYRLTKYICMLNIDNDKAL